jgi:hypothetical protein
MPEQLSFELMLEFFCRSRPEIHEFVIRFVKYCFRHVKHIFNPGWSKQRKWEFFRLYWIEIEPLLREYEARLYQRLVVGEQASNIVNIEALRQAISEISISDCENSSNGS